VPHPYLRLALLAGVSILLSATLGGCPVSATDLTAGAQVDTMAPGSYWVEQDGDTLAYFALPATRGDSGQWVAIAGADTSWYTDPGWYAWSPESGWAKDDALASLTLDDVVQTYDPQPAAGEQR
jgi:hypothetical protein